MKTNSSPTTWGARDQSGSEIWDSQPVFTNERVTRKDWLKLLFYPKKFLLYRFVIKSLKHKHIKTNLIDPLRVLDLGCGTGASVIDFKKIFGRTVEVIGIDVVELQVELAREKIKKYGVWAEFEWYDGVNIPFPAEYFDAVYTSDVLGHVANVPAWLDNIYRVLKPNGALAMFSESRLGRHAYIRRYLFKRGLNVDPHAEFHVSLYSKIKLRALLQKAGFEIKKMYGVFWASFLVHPDEFYSKLSPTKQFPFLRALNSLLYHLKRAARPFSIAAAELYGLIEMMVLGKWVESQGYVILAKKLK